MTFLLLVAQALTEDERAIHLLNRFTPGATPELYAEVRREGIRAWMEKQLQGDVPESDAFLERLAKFETLSKSWADITKEYDERVPKGATEKEKREARRRAAIPMRELLAWIGLRAVYSSNGVREVSADFFRNHFSISIEKGQVRFLVVDWEREIVFRRALGNFGDMLEASAKHPAMLFFLDNLLSRRPPTAEELKVIEARARKRGASEERIEDEIDLARQRGLNENYARELLELHTLGVDNYYTQQDVIEVAKCLTGWTIRRGTGTFEFNRWMHCAGDKTFLGRTIRENKASPVAEGEEVLERLKKHEGTAKFLAWKLCRWLVNDDPSPEMVARIAKVFRDSGGDLPKVYLAIAEDPEFNSRANFRAKFKRPWEFVVSALRAVKADCSGLLGLEQALNQMNEPLYRCADPTGYYDQAEAWCDPGCMATRWTFANDLVSGRVAGVRVPASFWSDLPAGEPKKWKDILVRKILPVAGIEEPTSSSIDALVARELQKNPKAEPGKLGALIAAAILGSPEFQKQ